MKNIKKYCAAFLGIASLWSGAFLLASAQGEDSHRPLHENHSPVCASSEAGTAHCHARVIVDTQGAPKASVLPAGYGPTDFHTAYANSLIAPNRQTIAIVDAY